MIRLILAVLLTASAVGSVAAQPPGTCESRAVSKAGKPLAGAAKNSFITNASETPAHPRRSDRTASPLRAPRKTASWRSACENKPDARLGPCAFRKSYPDVMVVQPKQDWDGDNDTGPLDCPT